MAPKKDKFRQDGAQHFQLVHRSQRDPLVHDPEASTLVFRQFERENVKRGKSRADLEQLLPPAELAEAQSRSNIGQAAEYGVYFDDSNYDYMQHLREVGEQEEGVDSVLIDAASSSRTKAGKGKDKDIVILQENSSSLIPTELLPSTSELPRNYESQQNVPTSISGFQPDMNPHLRQTLEALEDDAFVQDGLEDDFFGDLVADGEASDDKELDFPFEEGGFVDGEHGSNPVGEDALEQEGAGWELRFARFKKEQQQTKDGDEDDATERGRDASEGGDTVGSLPHLSVQGIRKRRRKGGSDASGYSMSSSSMYRNEHLATLDEHFDQVLEKQYNSDDEFDPDDDNRDDDEDDDEPPMLTTREDFDSILDDFLDKYEIVGSKMRPVLEGDSATAKLDTLRRAMAGTELSESEASKVAIKRLVGNEQEVDEVIPMPHDVDDIRDRWDCETILSTYSNLENHPRLIRAREDSKGPRIRLHPATGLPIVANGVENKNTSITTPGHHENLLDRTALHDGVLGDKRRTEGSRVTVTRPRGETKEEKQARKQAVKEEKQNRRADKKSMKETFADERKSQIKAQLGRTQGGQGLRKL